MSLSLLSASGVSLVLTRAKLLLNGLIFQKVGANFADSYQLTMTQNVGKTNTAKSRFAVKVPYTALVNGVTISDFAYVTVETTVPQDCPLTVASQLSWIVRSLAADTSFEDLVKNRIFSAS